MEKAPLPWGAFSHASHTTPIACNYHVVHVCVHVGSCEYCFTLWAVVLVIL